jgi:hypothetical protein
MLILACVTLAAEQLSEPRQFWPGSFRIHRVVLLDHLLLAA